MEYAILQRAMKCQTGSRGQGNILVRLATFSEGGQENFGRLKTPPSPNLP